MAPETVAALERVRASGRRLLLVTGRALDDRCAVFPHGPLFDRIIAENGAVLYDPANQQPTLLRTPPPEAFVQALRTRGGSPRSSGRVIVATWQPQELPVIDVSRELGLELQVTFHHGAVMVRRRCHQGHRAGRRAAPARPGTPHPRGGGRRGARPRRSAPV